MFRSSVSKPARGPNLARTIFGSQYQVTARTGPPAQVLLVLQKAQILCSIRTRHSLRDIIITSLVY